MTAESGPIMAWHGKTGEQATNILRGATLSKPCIIMHLYQSPSVQPAVLKSARSCQSLQHAHAIVATSYSRIKNSIWCNFAMPGSYWKPAARKLGMYRATMQMCPAKAPHFSSAER